MNIYMKNLDYSLSKTQVVIELARVLHQSPFRPSPAYEPINFDLQLHRPTNPVHNNRGSGNLTLPTIEIGRLFLNLHGSDRPRSPLKIGSRVTRFLLSYQTPNPEILEKINRLPFANPSTRGRRPQAAPATPPTVRVNVIQFGWICRDGAFSIEWEKNFSESGNMTFEDSRREIRINLHLEGNQYLVVIAFSSINTISASTNMDNEHCLFFDLNTPPSYEQEQRVVSHDPRRTPLRLKLPYLPIPEHDRVAPFASLAIRVLCTSDKDLSDFQGFCKKAQLHRVDDYDYVAVRRNLFSLPVMSKMHTRLQELDWAIAFQMESLLRSMAIDFQEADVLFPEIVQTVALQGEYFTAAAIRSFKNKAKGLFFEGEVDFDIVQSFRQTVEDLIFQGDIFAPRPTDGSLYESFHVEVTPTTFHLEGPFLEQSNRVIRAYDVKYHACFLRVSFLDEAHLHYRFDREVDGREFIQSRVRPLLYHGLNVAGRRFEFLAYSQSALKEHAVWFVKPFRNHADSNSPVSAASIISSLGTFHGLTFDKNLIYCPARYAARISQAFTATDAVKVEVEEVIPIPDISTSDGKYHFTDGVGTLSRELSQSVWSRLKQTRRKRLPKVAPSAYQIRFMGSKGMLSVDYALRGSTICLRPSMVKFLTPETVRDIEVARAFDRPTPYYLNRPLIMLLEGLGVPFPVFKRCQDNAVATTRRAGRSLKDAATLFETHGLGASFRLPSILLHLEKLGINSLPDDDFYKKMLEYGINHVLRDLKNRARIPVPGAWTLVGVADVHQFLRPNQIFACIKPINGGRRYLRGRVLVSRSPTIHPGDVKIVEAIGEPPTGSCFAEEPLTNTIVFSILGDRPLPSCLGGGDLDGDLYNLIPLDDPDLLHLRDFMPTIIYQPANYEPATRKLLDRPSTMRDVADFVMEYISSDVVGIIAINWLITADQSPHGIIDPDCLKLSELHSKAVDYPKSGQPVPLNDLPKLKSKRKPDWNAPETVHSNNNKNYYRSERAIGELFRAIDLPIEQQANLRPRRRRGRDGRTGLEEGMNNLGFQDARQTYLFETVQDAVNEKINTDAEPNEGQALVIERLFARYAVELQAICIANTLSHTQSTHLSEAEAVMGTIVQKTSQRRKREEMMAKVREGTDRLVRGIREAMAGDDSISAEDSLTRAWMAWDFSISKGDTFGAKSFGWVALGAIFEAIKEVEDEMRSRRT